MKELDVREALSVILSQDEELIELKERFWGERAPTDVLSFPTYEPGDPFRPPYLGEIFISLEQAERQAQEAGHPLEAEVLVLAAHGLWHLLGHDHTDEASWEGFLAVQRRILELA